MLGLAPAAINRRKPVGMVALKLVPVAAD